MILNKQQAYVLNKCVDWFFNSSEQVFQFSGGPGTGKSFLLNNIIRALGLSLNEIAPMSYIGCACIVMRTKGLSNAKTIHSTLFRPVEVIETDANGKVVMDTYFNRPKYKLGMEPRPLDGIKLLIIDEGGSVPYSLRDEILSRGIKVLVCGDLDQLPPVADKPAFLYTGKVYRLTECMRQAEGSSIVYLADRAIKGLPIQPGLYNDSLVIYEDELTDQMLSYSEMFICGKNKTRDYINNRYRHNILNIHSDIPRFGEKVICRKNNWMLEVDGISLANGLLGTVINDPGVQSFDNKTYKMDFKPINLNVYFKDLVCDYSYIKAPYEMKTMIKNNRYSLGEKFEFAYAISCHLSQGSQFRNGIYLEEFLSKDIQKNLNYTGITRFSQGMIYVKKKRKYFSFN